MRIEKVKLSETEETVVIHLSNGEKLRLSTYDWYGSEFLHKKDELNRDELIRLRELEESSKARYKLLSLLSYSGNSRKGFFEKLKKYGFSEESIDAALDFAEEQKLIDDRVYGENLIYELVEVKRYGPIRVRNEMYRHGVPASVSSELISNYDLKGADGLSVYDKNMYKVAIEKARGLDLSDPKQREKLFAALHRAGYEYSRISKLKFNKKKG